MKFELINSLLNSVRINVSFTTSVPRESHPLLFLYSVKTLMLKEKESVVSINFTARLDC